MSWTPGRRVGLGPSLLGARLLAPGALARGLARLGALALVTATIVVLITVWPDPPPPPPPTPQVSVRPPSKPDPPTVNAERLALPDAPGLPDVEVGSGDGPRYESTQVEEVDPPAETRGPEVVHEPIHEHLYEFDFRGVTVAAILAALAAVVLGFVFLPTNRYTLLLAAAASSLALWLGIDVVYAGQFPVVFDYRESFIEDDVRHIVTHYGHSHPVIVRVPWVVAGVGLAARAVWGTLTLYRAARRRSPRRWPWREV